MAEFKQKLHSLLEEIIKEGFSSPLGLSHSIDMNDAQGNIEETSPLSKTDNIVLITPVKTTQGFSLHLYTHVFFLNNQKISAKSLGAWFDGHFSSEDKFEDGSVAYDGLEIRLLMTLASALNFTVAIAKPKDGEKWGFKLANGSWNGKEKREAAFIPFRALYSRIPVYY
ncbi:hypothetical protein SK128_009433 [Halocaridina rubra]|uniref:Uncharacterized protein n=1 Tax=Halocaridina rubra TaxID=373956 RepID=A0AAN8WFX2_HALRR